MAKSLKSAGILAVLALLIAGCSKSSSPTSASSTPPDLTAPTFKGPGSTANSDTSLGAQTANQLATTFNAIASGYSAVFAQAGSPSQSGNTWTWKVTEGQASITFTATQSDTTYQWKYVMNGTYQGTTYNNWTAFEGSETASGANGNWILYNENSTTPMSKVSWTTDGSGTLTGNIIGYDSTGTETDRYTFVNNKDNSGSLEEYTNGSTLALKVTWKSDGSGQWWEYDDQGGVVGSGTWS